MLALVRNGSEFIGAFADGGWFEWPGGHPTCPAETKWPGADGYSLVQIVAAPSPPDGKRRILSSRRYEVANGVVNEVYDLEDDVNAYSRAIQSHIETAARQRGYDSILSAISYADSGRAPWAAEGVAFRVWRDDVWDYAVAELDKVRGGLRPQPTIADFLTELPILNLPEA